MFIKKCKYYIDKIKTTRRVMIAITRLAIFLGIMHRNIFPSVFRSCAHNSPKSKRKPSYRAEHKDDSELAFRFDKQYKMVW